jgi:acetyltransferase-like isoleucine patch superfamily enzyme
VKGGARLGGLLQRARILKYRALSTCENVRGTPILLQPVLFLGLGEIVVGERVEFGWPTSVHFHTGYGQVEASRPGCRIVIGDDVQINNDACIKSEGPGIVISDGALIGSGVCIYDSDFHELHPERRRGGQAATGRVVLERNVFVGDGATILKGVTIGADAVVGAGSVVTRDVPAGAVVAGNPARVVGDLAAAAEEPPPMARSLS